MELPRLEPLWRKYGDQGFNILAVEAFQDRVGAQQFIAENDLTFDLVEDVEDDDTNSAVMSQLQINGYPSSFLIDRQGRVLYFHFGFDEGDDLELEQQIQRLLAQ